MNRSATSPIQNSILNRRTFLKRTGAATLVLALGGGTYRAVDQGVFASGQGSAYEPWRIGRPLQKQGRCVSSSPLSWRQIRTTRSPGSSACVRIASSYLLTPRDI